MISNRNALVSLRSICTSEHVKHRVYLFTIIGYVTVEWESARRKNNNNRNCRLFGFVDDRYITTNCTAVTVRAPREVKDNNGERGYKLRWITYATRDDIYSEIIITGARPSTCKLYSYSLFVFRYGNGRTTLPNSVKQRWLAYWTGIIDRANKRE